MIGRPSVVRSHGPRALLLLVATAVAAAGAVDLAVIDNPRAIAIRDPAADNDWHRLYELKLGRAGMTVAALALRAPDQQLTLLATRLLYTGPPWRRRITDEDADDRRAWAERNHEVQDAILRELREQDDPSLGEVYRRYLGEVTDAELAISALINLAEVDPPLAQRAAAALAVPAAGGPAGATVPAVRSRACARLIETVGFDADETRAALTWALLSGTASERLAALAYLPPGAAPELVERAAVAMAEDHRRGRMDAEEQAALVQACARLRGVRDPALATALARLVTDGERPLAAAAATALSREITRAAVLPVASWVERALRTTDPAMRQALLGLILRHAPRDVRAVVDPASPWRALADHRERLAAWDWQGVVR